MKEYSYESLQTELKLLIEELSYLKGWISGFNVNSESLPLSNKCLDNTIILLKYFISLEKERRGDNSNES